LHCRYFARYYRKKERCLYLKKHWLGNTSERKFGGTRHRWKGRIKTGLEEEKILTALTWRMTGNSGGLM
jgi:hypothetical protein